jgi:hypothetical protein
MERVSPAAAETGNLRLPQVGPNHDQASVAILQVTRGPPARSLAMQSNGRLLHDIEAHPAQRPCLILFMGAAGSAPEGGSPAGGTVETLEWTASLSSSECQ